MMKTLFLLSMSLIAPVLHAQHFRCTVSVPNLQLGNYTGADVTSGVTPLSVTCPGSTPYTVSLRSSSSQAEPSMSGPHGYKLKYRLYRNASRSLQWGDTEGVNTLSSEGTGGTQTFNIYPSVAAAQAAPSGNYTDMLNVTVRSAVGTSTTAVPLAIAAVLTCSVAALPIGFGTYSPDGPSAATSTVTVSGCLFANVTIALNAGTSPGATVTTRKMVGPGSSTLSYGLYQDSAHTMNWGNTAADTETVTLFLTQVSATIYGLVPAGQYPAVGAYTDTVTASITF
jgi:spore coat protein U-like protein